VKIATSKTIAVPFTERIVFRLPGTDRYIR
jgi:hypothetical protein